MSRRSSQPAIAKTGASIATRLLLWFLAIAMVPCLTVTMVVTYLARTYLESSIRDRLNLITEAKTTHLESYIRGRRRDILGLSRAPGAVDAVVTLGKAREAMATDSPEYLRLKEVHRPELSRFIDIFGYHSAYLFDIKGNLLLDHGQSIGPGANVLTGPLRGTEFADLFYRGRTSMQASLSDFRPYPNRKQGAGFLSGPIYKDQVVIGVVIFEFANAEIFRVFADVTGLGETGEATVGMREGDQVVLVSPARIDAEAAFRTKYPIGGANGGPLQHSVKGERGSGEETDYRGRRVYAVWSYLPAFRWGLVVKQDIEEAFQLIRHLRYAVAALLFVTAAVVVSVAILVARSISRPIREAAQVAEAIASGDLTRQLVMTAPGESGQLLEAVRSMTRDLRTLIGKIQKSSVALMSTATEIAATSRQQEQTVLDYGASTNEAAAAVKEISATSQELLRTMDEINGIAGKTASMAATGQSDLAEMDRTMRTLADSTGSISSKLSVISERAANINMVVTTITKVADQTNLLSINAAIEAEKAGEYGLGFLVVAREIRRLADQTAVATLDIERMVKEMQSSVAAGVMEMDKFTDQVRQGVDEVGHINGQLGQIINAVRALTGQFEQVTEGMRVQAQGADQIREAVMRIDEGAGKTSVSLREFNKATGYMREAVSSLKEEVSRFTLGDAHQLPPPASGADARPSADRAV